MVKNSNKKKYVWCGYWDGVCKAIYADIPENRIDTCDEIDRWICDGADMLKRLPLEKGKKELNMSGEMPMVMNDFMQ